MGSEKNKLLKNTSIYALGDIIPRVLTFLVFPVLTSYLAPADYGITSYVNTLETFMLVFGLLNLNTYYLVFYYRQEDEEKKKKLLGNLSIFIFFVNLFIALAFILIGIVCPKVISSNIDFFPYIFMGVVTNFFNHFFILPTALYRLKENPLPLTILNIARGILRTIITVILVVKYDCGAYGVLMSAMIVTVFFSLVFICVTFKNSIFVYDWKQLKHALKFSLPLLPGSVAVYLISISDRMLIERYLDLTQLGIYSTAATLATILMIVSQGSYKAFEPYIFKNYNDSNFLSKFEKLQSFYFSAIFLAATGISLFSAEFFELFASDKYNGVYYYVPFVEFSVVLSSLNLLYSTVVTAQEKTKIISLVTLIGGACSVVLNISLLKHLGIMASCLASFTANLLMLSIIVKVSKIYINLWKTTLTLLLCSTVIGVDVYVLEYADIITSITIKIISYVVLVILLSKVYGINVIQYLKTQKR